MMNPNSKAAQAATATHNPTATQTFSLLSRSEYVAAALRKDLEFRL